MIKVDTVEVFIKGSTPHLMAEVAILTKSLTKAIGEENMRKAFEDGIKFSKEPEPDKETEIDKAARALLKLILGADEDEDDGSCN